MILALTSFVPVFFLLLFEEFNVWFLLEDMSVVVIPEEEEWFVLPVVRRGFRRRLGSREGRKVGKWESMVPASCCVVRPAFM